MNLKKIIIAVVGVWLLLAVVALVLTSMWGYGEVYYDQVDEDGDGVYDSIKIVDCDPNVKQMFNIPEKIEGLPVRYIDKYAFYGCEKLKSVVIPEGVISISENAFDACAALEEIKLPESLERIDTFAFFGCTGLTEITLPANMKEIGESAFTDCTGMTDFTLLSAGCVIFDSENTLPACTIHAGAGSTAQAYAERYGRAFETTE